MRDEFLYTSGVRRLEDALFHANDTVGAHQIHNASLLQQLQLGELLSPSGVATHTLFVVPATRATVSLKESYQMDVVPVPMATMNAAQLAKALEGTQGIMGVTCRGQGINASLALPRLAQYFLKYIDGHRSLGDIFRMSRAEIAELDSALFKQEFDAMYATFHACNNMYLTYNRPKYMNLYWVEKPKKHKGKASNPSSCRTKRCRLKQQKQESSQAEEDFGWKQKVMLDLGLHLRNEDGYVKGSLVL